MSKRSQSRRNKSREGSKAANSSTVATNKNEDLTQEAKSGSKRADYQRVQLSINNYVPWIKGMAAYVAANYKVGGESLKFLIEEKTEPPMPIRLDADKKTYVDAEELYQGMERKLKRLTRHRDELSPELQRLKENRRDLLKSGTKLPRSASSANSISSNSLKSVRSGPNLPAGVTPLKSDIDAAGENDEGGSDLSEGENEAINYAYDEKGFKYTFDNDPKILEEIEDMDQTIGALRQAINSIDSDIDDIMSAKSRAKIESDIAYSQFKSTKELVNAADMALFAAKQQLVREIFETDMFLPSAKKDQLKANPLTKDKLDAARQAGDIVTLLDIISHGLKKERVMTRWEMGMLKLQYKLKGPEVGENITSWLNRFETERNEAARYGVKFDEDDSIIFFINILTTNYNYKYINDFCKKFKANPDDEMDEFRDLPATLNDLIEMTTRLVLNEQQKSSNKIISPVFELTNTLKKQPAANTTNGASAASAAAVANTAAPGKNENSQNSKKLNPNALVPVCTLGCTEDGKLSRHHIKDCPLLSDKLRSSAKSAYNKKVEYLNNREPYDKNSKLETTVKSLSGSKAGKQAVGKAANVAAVDSDFNKWFTSIHESSGDESVNMINGYKAEAGTMFIGGIKQGQCDDGANISISDSSDNLDSITPIKPFSITGWSGGNQDQVNSFGLIPGFGKVFIKTGANCIFAAYQFYATGWTKSEDFGLHIDGNFVPMVTHWTKHSVTISFIRHDNHLWYAPFEEIIAKLREAELRSISVKNKIANAGANTRSKSKLFQQEKSSPPVAPNSSNSDSDSENNDSSQEPNSVLPSENAIPITSPDPATDESAHPMPPPPASLLLSLKILLSNNLATIAEEAIDLIQQRKKSASSDVIDYI